MLEWFAPPGSFEHEKFGVLFSNRIAIDFSGERSRNWWFVKSNGRENTAYLELRRDWFSRTILAKVPL